MKTTHLLLTARKHNYVIVGKDDPAVRRWKQNDIIHYITAMTLFYVVIHIYY